MADEGKKIYTPKELSETTADNLNRKQEKFKDCFRKIQENILRI